nr:MAG TPA: hypothetical protein [Caudoviricetes sp.]
MVSVQGLMLATVKINPLLKLKISPISLFIFQ